jgi:tripartite-type tricarboxylate transporter receptor subunit TctC
VPQIAGSTPDIVARLFADGMQERLGVPFVIENKSGAGGNLGTDAIAKADSDGYTIGVSFAGPLALNKILYSKLAYDPERDLTPITVLTTQPSILAAEASLGVSNPTELIALLRRNPDKYSYASIGTGSLTHLAMEMLAKESATKLLLVPYPSSPQAVLALVRGDVQMLCVPAVSVVSQLQTGRIKAIAVTSASRSPLLPELPTLKEAGIDVVAEAWIGLVAPANVDPSILKRIHDAALQVIKSPAFAEKLKSQFMTPVGNTQAEFKGLLKSEIERWGPLIKAQNIKVN